jgi:hypothetical protein
VKDVLLRKFHLKVDLNELTHELDNHPQLYNREKKSKEPKKDEKNIEEEEDLAEYKKTLYN